MSQQRRLGLRDVFGSVAAAFIGVQSGERRERDFSRGRPRDFIIVGVLLTLGFVLLVAGVVTLVTRLVQP